MKRIFTAMLTLAMLLTVACSLSGCSSEPTVTDIQLMLTAEKEEYIIGETFDPTGIMLTAVYSDGTRQEITDYTFYPDGPLTAEDTAVTIQYGEYTFENPITVISASEKVVLTLNNGVDRCELQADGTAALRGGGGGGDTGVWSWDGQTLEISLPLYNNGVRDDFVSPMELTYDEQNNITFRYVLKGKWTINYFCSYKDWSAVLTPDVKYPL